MILAYNGPFEARMWKQSKILLLPLPASKKVVYIALHSRLQYIRIVLKSGWIYKAWFPRYFLIFTS